MAIIAITEQLGSCGVELARIVADRLGYALMTRDDMISRAAERYRVSAEHLVVADERQPHFWERKADTRKLITFFRAVTLEAMAADRIVCVSRAIAHLMPEPACGLRVHVIGPFERRVARVMKAENLSQAAAERRVRDFDRELRARVQSVAGTDIDDASLYDLVLNASARDPETMAEVLCEYARRIDGKASQEDWQRVRDAALAKQVLAELLNHPKLAGVQVEVECRGGVANVDGPGLVEPWDELVRQVCSRVAGVREVRVAANDEPVVPLRQ